MWKLIILTYVVPCCASIINGTKWTTHRRNLDQPQPEFSFLTPKTLVLTYIKRYVNLFADFFTIVTLIHNFVASLLNHKQLRCFYYDLSSTYLQPSLLECQPRSYIPTIFLYICKFVLGHVLTKIFNLSLESGAPSIIKSHPLYFQF